MVLHIKWFIQKPEWRRLVLWCGLYSAKRLKTCQSWSVPRIAKLKTRTMKFAQSNQMYRWSVTGIPGPRTKNEFICNIYGDDTSYNENPDIIRNFELQNIPLLHKWADMATNAYGAQLLDFCKSNSLFILNGRIGTDKISPKLTCKNSIVDYVLTTSHNFRTILDFDIMAFNGLFSDAHCCLKLKINHA